MFETFDTSLLSELPFFGINGPLTESEIFILKKSFNHIDIINEFKSTHSKKFIMLYLNINSVFNKVHELDEVLEKCDPDCFLIDESKLDNLIPNSWYVNKKYNCIRLDREDKEGGGELAFIKKGIIIKKQELTDFESIYIQLYIEGQLVNIILSYKSPSVKNDEFLEKLENFIMLLDPCESLFIVGDLNMDLRSVKGFDLKNFLIRNELKNYVEQHTRVCRSYYKKK